MTRRLTHILAGVAGFAAVALMVMPRASGHETDNFTLPRDRQFADMGPFLNAYFYDHIAEGAKRINDRVANAKRFNRPQEEIEKFLSEDEVVKTVSGTFPNAMALIEALDMNHLGAGYEMIAPPGEVLGYKEAFTNIYEHAHFILDPRQIFRIWLAKTFVAYGTYLGTDKIGHFTDMGLHYWGEYRNARKSGATEEEATAHAVELGTHGLIFSERGMLGYLSAGSYSNADVAADYLGFLFYRNLTGSVTLKGRQVPAILEREGDVLKISPRVQRDNDFFADYVDDRLSEAFNPSRYEKDMRGKIRAAVKQRQASLLDRFSDENGCRRSMGWFESKARECFTYYGTEYGHNGEMDELVTFANTFFDPLPASASPSDRNDRGYTPLHDAVIRNDMTRVMWLLAHGADVNAVIRSAEPYSSEWGATALHLAARDGRREMVEFLLTSGAKVGATDDRGATPLHYAASSPEIATLLIERGGSPAAVDVFGRTPLHWAANLGKADSIEALVKHGANVNTADRAGRTPLHLAAGRGEARAVSRLLENGANASAADRMGDTPLHFASQFWDTETETVLLDHHAAASAKDAYGLTPLHEACRLGRTSAVQALLARGATPSATDLSGITPLHLAARGGHDATVQALVTRGADANARSALGSTPLHEAAFSGRAPVITALTAAGSDRLARDLRGRTPRDIATDRGHADVVVLLVAPSPGTGTPAAAAAAARGAE